MTLSTERSAFWVDLSGVPGAGGGRAWWFRSRRYFNEYEYRCRPALPFRRERHRSFWLCVRRDRSLRWPVFVLLWGSWIYARLPR